MHKHNRDKLDSRLPSWLLLVLFFAPCTGCTARVEQAPPETHHDPGLILFVGNSLTRGSGASKASESYPAQTMRLLDSGDAWENLGHDSITTAQMLLDAPLLVDVQLDGTRPITVVAWEVGNDLWYGATQDDAFKHYADYCNGRRALGARVIAVTVPRRSNPTAPATWEASRQAVNTRIIAERASFADDLVDVDPLFPAVSSVDYASDGIHFNDTGYAKIAGRVSEHLQDPATGL